MGQNIGFDHYQKKYSHNLIQTWGVHLLGECSELIRFWATLAKFWPSSGHKITEMVVFDHYHAIQSKLGVYTFWVSVQNWFAFWPLWPNFGPLVATKWLKMKSIHAIQFKLDVCTYWVSVQNWFAFWPLWPNVGPQVATKWLKMKSIHVIQFKLDVCTYWVSVQKWFAFWPRWLNFGPLVATKWPKMVVSDHYQKKYSRNPIQTWCVHLLGECSEIICFLAVFVKF